MAAAKLEELGLTPTAATELAATLAEQMGIAEPSAIDALLDKYTTLSEFLSPAGWCSCISRQPDLLTAAPESLNERLKWLQQVYGENSEEVAVVVCRCPELLQQETAAKVNLLLRECSTAEVQGLSTAQLISRLSHAPSLLSQPLSDLEAKLSHMAAELSISSSLAAQILYWAPQVAGALRDVSAATDLDDPQCPSSLLQQRLDVLEQLLCLDAAQARALVLRQPVLLVSSLEDLQHQAEVLSDLIGHGHLAEIAAAAPHLFVTSPDAVVAQNKLLEQLVQLQPHTWQGQLDEASATQHAVWLAASDRRLRRLELAASNQQLCRLSIYKLLSYSESTWLQHAAAAGIVIPSETAGADDEVATADQDQQLAILEECTESATSTACECHKQPIAGDHDADPAAHVGEADLALNVDEADEADEALFDVGSQPGEPSQFDEVEPEDQQHPILESEGPTQTTETGAVNEHQADTGANHCEMHEQNTECQQSADHKGVEADSSRLMEEDEENADAHSNASSSSQIHSSTLAAAVAEADAEEGNTATAPASQSAPADLEPTADVSNTQGHSVASAPDSPSTPAAGTAAEPPVAKAAEEAASHNDSGPQPSATTPPATEGVPAEGSSRSSESPAGSSSNTITPSTNTPSSASCSDSATSKEMERREAFMTKLLAKVPAYAVKLLGTDQAEKLQFLSHMAAADLSAVLAQPRAEELLEAVYAVHLKKKQQQQSNGPTIDDSQLPSTTSSVVQETSPAEATKASVSKTAAHQAKSPAAASASPSKAANILNQNATNLPAVTAASKASFAGTIIIDRGRKYVFLDGPVCGTCGSKGHLAGDCRTTRCLACQQVGHPFGKCKDACGVCGKRHRAGPCTQPQCYYCKLYGHNLEQCPTAHCKKCDHYGHVASLCPMQKQSVAQSSSSGSRPAAPASANAATATAVKPPAVIAISPATPTRTGAAPAAASTVAAGSISLSNNAAAARTAMAVPPRLPAQRAAAQPAPAPAAREPAVLQPRLWQQLGRLAAPASTPTRSAAAGPAVPAAHPARAAAAPSAAGTPASPAATKGVPIQDGNRTYLFIKGVVCSRCGKHGHLSSLCDTTWCGQCEVFGHRYGECHQACQVCGRRHAFTHNRGEPVCYTSYCDRCDLYSHTADECPSSHCSSCGFWGHLHSNCPVQQQQQQQQHAPVAAQSSSSGFSSSTQHFSRSSRVPEAAISSGAHGSTISSSNSGRYNAGGGAVPGGRNLRSDRLDQPVPSTSSTTRNATSTAPAATAAASPSPSSSTKWLTLTDSGRQYKCHQYPACNKCGTVGHLPSACTTPNCSACGKYGHQTGGCHTACPTCGKKHESAAGGCYMPLCPICHLFGHIGKHCPSAKCSICGYYGHLQRICPDQYLVEKSRAGAAAGAQVSSNRPGGFAGGSRTDLDRGYQGPNTGGTNQGVEPTAKASHAVSSSSISHDGWDEGHTAVSSSSSRQGRRTGWDDSTGTGTTSRSSRIPAGSASDTPKKYRFLGNPVCGRCGRSGHEATECHSEFCNSCEKWGHATGSCMGYCRRCGKNHARGGCTMALCSNCQLWGHVHKFCPAVQCSVCGFWGHDGRVCPDAQQQPSSNAQGGVQGPRPTSTGSCNVNDAARPIPGVTGAAAANWAGSSESTAQGKDTQGWNSHKRDAGADDNRGSWGGVSASTIAATKATRGSNSSAWGAPVNAPEDSWTHSAAGKADSSSIWAVDGAINGGGAHRAGGVQGGASAAAADSNAGGSSSIRQFKLEAPGTEEEEKVRGARLVHVLFTSLPDYASKLMGDKEKLACLARLSTADVDYIIAQAHPEQLLEAVYKAHLTRQKHQMKAQWEQKQPSGGQYSTTNSGQPRQDTGSNTGLQQQPRKGFSDNTSTLTSSYRIEARRQAAIVGRPVGAADSSSLLTQRMAATLAGFKKGQQHSQGYAVSGDAAAGALVEFSEEEDVSDMLGLLGIHGA